MRYGITIAAAHPAIKNARRRVFFGVKPATFATRQEAYGAAFRRALDDDARIVKLHGPSPWKKGPPPVETDVIVCLPLGDMVVAKWNGNRWRLPTGIYIDRIAAWRKLPAPPASDL